MVELNHHPDTIKAYEKWAEAVQPIIPQPAPDGMTWTKREDIAAVLDKVRATTNYLFLPNGGGVHIYGAAVSNEPDCITVFPDKDREVGYIIKARKLHLNRPGEDLAWSYFVIEADALPPVFKHGNIADSETHSSKWADFGVHAGLDQEEVHLYENGTYGNPNAEQDEDDEVLKYTRNWRRLTPGLYLLVNNIGAYNELNDHDGRHNARGMERLVDYMERLYKAFAEKFGTTNFLAARPNPQFTPANS